MASLADLLPRGEPRPIDPGSRRLATAVIRLALSDARRGRRLHMPSLEAWGSILGLEPHRIAEVFNKVRSRDPATLAQITHLGKARSRLSAAHVAERKAAAQRRRWAKRSPEERRAHGEKLRATLAAKRAAR